MRVRTIGTSLVIAGLLIVAVSLVGFTSALASPGELPVLQGQGNCLTGDGVVKHDESGGHTFTADPGYIWVEAGFKAGDACYTRSSDGVITVEGEDCYRVQGLGTSTLTITQLKESNVCNEISHTEGRQQQEPTNTPPPPTATPDPTSTPTETPEPTEGPSPTPTLTPEVSPTPQPTQPPPPPEDPPTGPGDPSIILWLLSGLFGTGLIGAGIRKFFLS